jgi:SAM-dependent methyltransferase
MKVGYGRDLAYVHDAGFGHFSRDAAPGLLDILRRQGIQGGVVVDLGCGSGLWARRLADAGYSVLGIDTSPSMIATAKQRVPEGRFRRQSLFSAELPDCGAVTSIGECFSYLFDSHNTWKGLVAVLKRIHEALHAGGVLVFDVAAPGRLRGRHPAVSQREGKDWAILVSATEDRRRRLLARRITTFRRVGEFYRRTAETHYLRLFQGLEVARELRAIGFRVHILRGYGQFRFGPGQIGFLARKA